MPTVEIMLNGRQHVVQCGQGEESRVRQLASYIDRRIADLGRGQAPAGDARLLVLATLKIADELSDAYDEIKRLRTALGRAGPRRIRCAGGRAGAGCPADRSYCRRAGERLTKPGRVLPGALGPRKPWGQRFSVRELSLPGPWPRYYGAHLRPQATEESRYRRLRRPRLCLPRTRKAVSIVHLRVSRPAQNRPESGAASEAAGRGGDAGRHGRRGGCRQAGARLPAAGCRHRVRLLAARRRARSAAVHGPACWPRPPARPAAGAGAGPSARLPCVAIWRSAVRRTFRRHGA